MSRDFASHMSHSRTPAAGRPARGRPTDTRAIDRRAILAAALRLVDSDGIDALSMRKLGALLGVQAMTLYYYIPSKAELVQGITEIVLDELQVPEPPADDWQATVRDVARSFRELGLRHPNVFPTLATVGLDNPSTYRPLEAILRTLSAAGFTPELAFIAFATIKSYVVGHTLWLLGDQLIGRGGCDAPADPGLADGYPTVAGMLPYITACDPDAEFERGLDLLIAGLQEMVRRR